MDEEKVESPTVESPAESKRHPEDSVVASPFKAAEAPVVVGTITEEIEAAEAAKPKVVETINGQEVGTF